MRRPDVGASALSIGVGALLVLGAASCGGVELGPDDVILKRAEVAELRAAAARVPELTAEITRLEVDNAALTKRVKAIEVRLGIAAFEPTELKALGDRATLPDALVLADPTSRPQRKRLSSVLDDTDRGLVIAFWATWCKPCISDEELVWLRKLQRQLRSSGSDLVSMAVDGLDDVQAHDKFRRFVYPLYQRDRGHYDILPQRFIETIDVNLPLFLLVSKSGEIVWYRDRQLTDAAVADMVNAISRM